MKPQSCKAKGRNLQKLVCKAFQAIGSKKGLEEDDVKSTSMGVNGVDVQFSPAARKVFGDVSVECKNHESLNVTSVFWQHYQKYKGSLALLCHKKNHCDPLVTLRLSDFMQIYERSLNNEWIIPSP